MMLRRAIGLPSLVIIQSEITDAESNVWLHLAVQKQVSFLKLVNYAARFKPDRRFSVFFLFLIKLIKC